MTGNTAIEKSALFMLCFVLTQTNQDRQSCDPSPLRKLDAADQEEDADLLSKAYEHLICAYQEAREINDELEELLKNTLMN